MHDLELKQIISQMLPDIFFNDISISPISGGKNNRSYHVCLDKKSFFLKKYNPIGNRNRLLSEYQFLTYTNKIGSHYTVKPLACDPNLLIALYEYQFGERYLANTISIEDINHAVQFLSEINKEKTFEKEYIAQEACFSIAEHLECIEQRVNRLKNIDILDSLDQEVYDFIQEKLVPAWYAIKNNVLNFCDKKNFLINEIISNEERIISPSDFGFHNAIKLQNNKIVFVDFEYAGWDDPAKLIGDFFHQIEIPISIDYFEQFSISVAKLVRNFEKILMRSRILFPAYCLKWCCIILNYFSQDSKVSKNFSTTVTHSVRKIQFQKAKMRLKTLGNAQHIINF